MRISHLNGLPFRKLQIITLYFGVAISSTHANSTFNELKNAEISRIEAGSHTQAQVDQLDDERLELSHQYRAVLKQNDNLERYNEQLQDTLHSQADEIALIQQQITRVAHLERDIIPLMSDMLNALENFIALDTPFLIEERRSRIETLQQLLSSSNVSNSEKYRRILEAYQIENDYGRTIEAYEGSVKSHSGTSVQRVSFLKVGRLALIYQTPDKQNCYIWSPAEKHWVRLEDKYNENVDKGIKMAREQVPFDLLSIPLVINQKLTSDV